MMNFSDISSVPNMAGNAMRVHSTGMQVCAHNIANVSTGDFDPQRVTYATGPAGQGVELESVRKMPSAWHGNNEPGPAAESLWGGKRPGGTELARELPQMISVEHGYKANAAVISASEDMFATLLDIKA